MCRFTYYIVLFAMCIFTHYVVIFAMCIFTYYVVVLYAVERQMFVIYRH